MKRSLYPILLLMALVCLAANVASARTVVGLSRQSLSTAAPWIAGAARAQTAVAPAEKEVTVFGVRISYLEAGSGPTVILLHGLGGNSQVWAPNIGPLAQKFRVIVPDQVGFGKSDKPLINYRLRTYVDFLDQFCKELGIQHASIVGNSMGGWIAASYTLAFPEKVDRLVLEDAAGYSPPRNFDSRILFSLNPSTREGMRLLAQKIFYNKAFSSDAVIDQVLAQRITAGDGYTIKSMIESIIRGEDFLDNRLQAIRKPTLIIWGRQDGLTPLADGERFKREIPNSRLIVMEQCGHVPNIEKVIEFNAAVLRFLQ